MLTLIRDKVFFTQSKNYRYLKNVYNYENIKQSIDNPVIIHSADNHENH